MKKRWTKDELEFLNKNYNNKDIDFLCKNLNRTKSSVYKKAMRLGLTEKTENWSEEDIDILTKYWGKRSKKKITEMLGRSVLSINKKARELGLGPTCIANGEYLTTGDVGYLLNKDPIRIYFWIKQGLIKGIPYGNKPIYRIAPEEFITFIRNHPEKWKANEVNIDLIKPYLRMNNCCKIPSWFKEKIEEDRQEYFVV